MPLLIRAWLDEEFHLHLFELTRAEDEVSRSDFVAERLADLTDAERRLHASRSDNVCEVYENALSGLWAKVVQAFFSGNWTKEGLKQTVERLWFGPNVLATTVRAGDVVHALRSTALLLLEGLFEVVLTKTLVARGAFDQRVRELTNVTRSFPHLARKNDGRV